jgi:hypothetical protein
MSVGGPAGLEERAAAMQRLVGELTLEAVEFAPPGRMQEMARHWLGDREDRVDDPAAAADAIALALTVGLFNPSAAGTTAIDRLARQKKQRSPEEKAALAALQRAAFRILELESEAPEGGYRALDLATGERFLVLDTQLPEGWPGLRVATRLVVVEGEVAITAGPIMPLDEEALAVAQARMRAGGRGLTNPARCAEAIYRHIVRFGTLEVPGLNRPLEEDDDALAFALAEASPPREPTAEEVQAARDLVSIDVVMEALVGVVASNEIRASELAGAYEKLLEIQLETVERRSEIGIGSAFASLDTVAALIEEAVAKGLIPEEARSVFETTRLRVRAAGIGRAHKPDLDKVLARIQALRAKTVDRGCTEEEAIAAARKVAELLDRHGLQLSEVELRSQACEGFGVVTGRRRMGPIDTCIPAVAMFCDCRVWGEKAQDGELRYVFFGLPADVAGARYLYELVVRAFETETATFKRGELYAEHDSGDRRSATISFQTGLADGIARKLRALRQERDAAMRTATGRDLIPLKEGVIEDELAKLGLHFKVKDGPGRRYVLKDAYAAGHEAGERFEHRPGIAGDGDGQGSSTIAT